MNNVCFRTRNLNNPSDLATYESVGGYSTLKRIVNDKLEPATIKAIKKVEFARTWWSRFSHRVEVEFFVS